MHNGREKEIHVLRVNLGIKFEHIAKDMDQGVVREVRERCAKFLHKLFAELKKRLLANKDILMNCVKFNPHKLEMHLLPNFPSLSFVRTLVQQRTSCES